MRRKKAVERPAGTPSKYRLEDRKGGALSPWFDDMGEAVRISKSKRIPMGARLVRDDGVVLSIKPSGSFESKEDMKDAREKNNARWHSSSEEEDE